MFAIWERHKQNFGATTYETLFEQYKEFNKDVKFSHTTSKHVKEITTTFISLMPSEQLQCPASMLPRLLTNVFQNFSKITLDEDVKKKKETLLCFFEREVTTAFKKDTLSLSHSNMLAKAYHDAGGQDGHTPHHLIGQVGNKKDASSDDIFTSFELALKLPGSPHTATTISHLIDTSLTSLDKLSPLEIKRLLEHFESFCKNSEISITPEQITTLALHHEKSNFSKFSYRELFQTLKTMALLGYENKKLYAKIIEEIDSAELSTQESITCAWALTISGTLQEEEINNFTTLLLTTLAENYDKNPNSFDKVQLTQLLWVKRGYEEADLEFPLDKLCDKIEDFAKEENPTTISKSQQRLYNLLCEYLPSKKTRKIDEWPYIEHEPNLAGLQPDMLLSHQDGKEQVIEFNGPNHYLDRKQCTHLNGNSKCKIRLLAKKADKTARDVIVISSREWDNAKEKKEKLQILQEKGIKIIKKAGDDR